MRVPSVEKPPQVIAAMGVDNKGASVLEGSSPNAMDKDFKLLSDKTWKKFHTRGLNLVCLRCGKPIEAGELYHTTGPGRKIKKFYHKGCWERLLH